MVELHKAVLVKIVSNQPPNNCRAFGKCKDGCPRMKMNLRRPINNIRMTNTIQFYKLVLCNMKHWVMQSMVNVRNSHRRFLMLMLIIYFFACVNLHAQSRDSLANNPVLFLNAASKALHWMEFNAALLSNKSTE